MTENQENKKEIHKWIKKSDDIIKMNYKFCDDLSLSKKLKFL